jgi:hypothetical protein
MSRFKFPNHGISTPGAKTDKTKFDFFLLSAQEYNMPNQLGRQKQRKLTLNARQFYSLTGKVWLSMGTAGDH